MFKENNLSKGEENQREENLRAKSPKIISNQGVLIECNLLDNNNYNLEIR